MWYYCARWGPGRPLLLHTCKCRCGGGAAALLLAARDEYILWLFSPADPGKLGVIDSRIWPGMATPRPAGRPGNSRALYFLRTTFHQNYCFRAVGENSVALSRETRGTNLESNGVGDRVAKGRVRVCTCVCVCVDQAEFSQKVQYFLEMLHAFFTWRWKWFLFSRVVLSEKREKTLWGKKFFCYLENTYYYQNQL